MNVSREDHVEYFDIFDVTRSELTPPLRQLSPQQFLNIFWKNEEENNWKIAFPHRDFNLFWKKLGNRLRQISQI